MLYKRLQIKVKGWDGHEDESKQKWTFLGFHFFTTITRLTSQSFLFPNAIVQGSLFYSIVLISTIGYGDQTPKTQWGKVLLLE